jgi:hypothetical protein
MVFVGAWFWEPDIDSRSPRICAHDMNGFWKVWRRGHGGYVVVFGDIECGGGDWENRTLEGDVWILRQSNIQ